MKPINATVVYYVENATPKAKSFKTLTLAKKWADDYQQKHLADVNDGWWVDQIVCGTIYIYNGEKIST